MLRGLAIFFLSFFFFFFFFYIRAYYNNYPKQQLIGLHEVQNCKKIYTCNLMHLYGKKLGIFYKIVLRSFSSEIDFKREIFLGRFWALSIRPKIPEIPGLGVNGTDIFRNFIPKFWVYLARLA